MRKYKENHLMWMVNEEIPFSNNESKRSLRSSKTKMKVSGQETGLRHGMNVKEIIKCALEGMKSHEK